MPASQPIDWTSIINNTIAQVPSWMAIAQHQPVPVAVPPGTQGGALAFTSQGVSASISPSVLIVGALAIIAIIYVVNR